MARVKEVYSTGEISHLWAHQSVSKARNPQGNLFFEGLTIYSYRYSFIAATFVEEMADVILINSNTYSVTTAGHLRDIRYSVRGLGKDIFTVPSLNKNPDYIGHRDNVKHYIGIINEALKKAARARSNKQYLEAEAARTLQELHRYTETFNYQEPHEYSNIPSIGDAGEHADALAKAEKEQRAKELQEKKEALAEWKAGTRDHCRINGNDYLRIKGNEVQTTQGIRIPIQAAAALYLAIKAGRNVVGQKIEYYTIRSVTDKHLIAGCHTIPMTEIKEIGEQLINQ